ncbi:MAG: FAD-binding oxidoreductase [Reyranellaceae bacterium]
MNRRTLLSGATATALLGGHPTTTGARAQAPFRRVRPSDADWPSAERWRALAQQVGGRLAPVPSPWKACAADSAACDSLFKKLRNPFFIGDDPALTQTLGWVDAWTSQPSAWAVAAESARDVAAAVDFARAQRLRLVVKGGGHSYLGTSNAADSLLVWTRRMKEIVLHDAFVGDGCDGRAEPVPAVSLGAGVLWGQAYDAVTTRAGRYVQGGGCTTVGVAGLIQSGGFGSFSKRYGLAAAGLLEAELVTADGQVRTVNACREPDLFWGLKGGGGGSLGIVTRLTLRTHELPASFGGVQLAVKARTDEAYRRLIGQVVDFYADRLCNPSWGEQIAVRPDNTLDVAMVFQGLAQAEAEAIWRPFLDSLAGQPDLALAGTPRIVALPARLLWNPLALKAIPGLIVADDRPEAPAGNFIWGGDAEQVGQVLQAYQSTWLPGGLLAPESRPRLAQALFEASRHRRVSLHFNKGLAGAPAEAVAAARDTATNPAAAEAFALAICAGSAPPAYPGIAGHEPDVARARDAAARVERAMQVLRRLVSAPASYVSESDYFEADWQNAYWGPNYPRLRAVKERYDPEGLFFVHHGVGSEAWSADGFVRR